MKILKILNQNSLKKPKIITAIGMFYDLDIQINLLTT